MDQIRSSVRSCPTLVRKSNARLSDGDSGAPAPVLANTDASLDTSGRTKTFWSTKDCVFGAGGGLHT
jgi:hypothetical protein